MYINIERSYKLCHSVGFNHDGTKIVSGSNDNTIRVWNVDTGECIFNGNQLEDTLRNEFNRTLQVPLEEHFNYDTKSIIGMSGEGQNINPEMYIGKKRGEKLVCVIKDSHRIHIMEHRGWQSQLYIACEDDNVEFVESLLDNKSLDVNKAIAGTNDTPLYVACANDSFNVSSILLDVPSINLNNDSLFATCRNGNTSLKIIAE